MILHCSFLLNLNRKLQCNSFFVQIHGLQPGRNKQPFAVNNHKEPFLLRTCFHALSEPKSGAYVVPINTKATALVCCTPSRLTTANNAAKLNPIPDRTRNPTTAGPEQVVGLEACNWTGHACRRHVKSLKFQSPKRTEVTATRNDQNPWVLR